MPNTIHTHNEAALIVEIFEELLDEHDITVPSLEDDERDEAINARLYGSTFSMLLDLVEERLIDILNRKTADTIIKSYEFGFPENLEPPKEDKFIRSYVVSKEELEHIIKSGMRDREGT